MSVLPQAAPILSTIGSKEVDKKLPKILYGNSNTKHLAEATAIVNAIAATDTAETETNISINDSIKYSPKELRGRIVAFESAISSLPEAKFGDDATPLEHIFADGLYIRKMIAPKGMLNVSKLHKTTHPYFILSGDVSVITEAGVVRIKAPHTGITKAGTKRVVYFHEDTVWITVHPTKETDLEKIEKELIAKDYNDLPERVKEALQIGEEEKECLGYM